MLASVLFTDIVDSTATVARLGPDRGEVLRREHFALLRAVIEATGGNEVKNTGDGLMVAYNTPSGALAGAIGMQQAVARHNARSADPMLMRVGLSVGEVYQEDGDYFGETVIQAARLCSLAEGEQILATELVRTMAGRHAPFEFRSVGPLSLKGLPDPVDCVVVHWSGASAESPVPFPSMLAGVNRDSLFGFVGRVAELGVLYDAQKSAFTEPRLHTVLVGGEAGIGKTALIAQAAATSHEAGSIVLLGHCDEGVTAPFQVWIQALSHLAEHVDGVSTDALSPLHRNALARLVPAYRDAAAVTTDAESDRAVLGHAVESVLRWVAAEHPIVIVFDDLQWADAASLHLLRSLISSAGEMAVMVVCTYRHTDLAQNEPLTALLADMHRLPGVTRMKLVGLDDAETVELMQSATGHELDDDSVKFAYALRRETDGNPFFTRELLRHIREDGGAAEASDGPWFAEGGRSSTSLPASIRDVVARRVARLGADGVQILAAASVLGCEFDLDVLAQITGRTEDDVLDVLEAATDAAIVRERADGPASYRFVHALIQRTLYEDLGGARRARTHRRAAEVLETVGGRGRSPSADLARHWVATLGVGEEEKALRYTIEAADSALASLAPDDAIRWYRQAIDLASRQEVSDQVRGRLLVGMGSAQRQVGDAGFRTSLLDAADLARRSDDTELLVAAVLAADLGVAGTSVADVELVEATEAAIAAIGTGDSVARARLLSILSQKIHADEWERRRELSTEAVEVARRLGDHATLSAVLPVAYQHYGPEGLHERTLDTAQAIESAVLLANPMLLCNALFHRIDVCMQTLDLVEVDARIAQLAAEAGALGLPMHLWQLHMITSMRVLITGDCEQAEAEATAAFQAGSAGGHAEAMAAFGGQLIEIRRQQGRLGEMVGFLQGAASENSAVPGFRQMLASVYCEVGQHDDAAALFEVDLATGFDDIPRDAAWLTITSHCADVAATIGSVDGCRFLYTRLQPYGHQIGSIYSMSMGAVARHLGRLATITGDHDLADEHFAEALDLHARMGSPYWSALTKLDLVDLLVRRNAGDDVDRAKHLLVEARATGVDYGFGGIVERSDRVAARLDEVLGSAQ